MRVQNFGKGESLLLLATFIWGLSFIAQVEGMNGVGPFMFVAIRFLLGALALGALFFVPFFRQLPGQALDIKSAVPTALIGLFLWLGSAFQQVGLQYTSIANASFITSTYIIIVPVAGFLFRQPPTTWQIVGAFITLFGVALLSFGDAYVTREPFEFHWGDVLQLIGAFFWAAQIWCLSVFAGKYNNLHLAIWQSFVCGVLSLVAALVFEVNTLQSALSVWPWLLFAGIIASGLAYSAQVFGQRTVPPARAVFIFCLEAVFATIAGVLLLGQGVSVVALGGCGFVLAGIFVAQYRALSNAR